MASPSSEAELAGRTAVVTGSSRELARAGAAVVIHGASGQHPAEQLVAEIRSGGGEAEAIMADLSEPEGRSSLVYQSWQWRGAVDIWVNNAGADVLTGAAAEWAFEQKLDRLMEVDVRGTIALSREVGARMKQHGSGIIVNIGWDGAERGMAGDSGELFAAAKGAVMAFTRSLAQSLAPEVRVNCLAPGWIRTAWGTHASEYWQQRVQREALLGRWGTPDDVARAVRFFASPGATYLNGQIVHLNGGFCYAQDTREC
jgi:3-oxoacyl-[acyl-carrier protein] reductase